MSDFETKTDYLLETKSLLKDRINSLGGSITSGTTFRDYLVWLDSLYEALDEKTITGLPDSLEGKCEQDGTPTPTNPIPINITTGRQVVSVCGKNLLNINNWVKGRINNSTGNIEYANNVSSMTIGETDIKFVVSQAWNSGIASDFIPISTGNYVFKYAHNREITMYIDTYNNQKSRISRIVAYTQTETPTTRTFTISDNSIAYIRIHFEVNTANVEYIVSDMQLEKGTATTYEEYKGNDYEINLGKNLYYMNYNDTTNSNWNGVDITSTHTGYSLSGTATSGTAFTLVGRYITLEKGTYSFVLKNASATRIGLSKTNYSSIIRLTAGTTSGTFTLNEKTNVCLTIEISNGATYNEENEIMICKGTDVGDFSPYKTPIYLGKIGNYQDYIFRNTTENPLYDSNLEEGQWYIHKEIGRVVLNGSENWGYVSNSQVFWLAFTGFKQSGLVCMSNYYEGQTNVSVTGLVQNNHITFRDTDVVSSQSMYIKDTSITSANNFKTWLSSHNVEVYYVLNTPTNTLIEDEELINQLNEIEIFTVISENFYN